MKKRFLTFLNIVLGISALTLAGCHTQKKAVADSSKPDDSQAAEERVDGPVICMYGVPANLYRPERVSTDSIPMDTTAAEEPKEPVPPRPMLKYGVPNPRISR